MFFVGIITDKNSEINIKKSMHDFDNYKIIFLNEKNIENFRNVKFDSVLVNSPINFKGTLGNILKNSKYIVWNSDIHCKEDEFKDICSKIITYGYNSKANVTVSSATDENYLFYVQSNISGYKKVTNLEEIRFKKSNKNLNAYDGMMMSIIDIIYN